MKSTILSAFLLFFTHLYYSQDTVSVSGGIASGSGSVSYSVGQLFVSTVSSNSGSVTNGVQQSFELFTLVNPELKTLTLKAITFPNPTKDNIMLSLTDNDLKELSYKVYDINGRLVRKGKVNKENTPISMNNLSRGVYLLKVNQNKKRLKVFKIIKN
ncbi:T9SS type A sorting domain-containing protein [Polaribacter ponticola]|uniref:T9SS type A sorting domain-containing protein n=1 Tax=Polaribacter ponticola TaxID=2978475 RepID=A0ABT5SEM5_9FLAO|nr:T9SS type A sorting domain-containing protein [Polaribacter sp. MSW5]MDD7915886.1 T9SS type A sorting domain-containing protein [Polaribacter sp. MSW5]